MKIPIIVVLVFLNLIGVSFCQAVESSHLKPMENLVPYSFQAYVNTTNCTPPIKSSPYVILFGNGGANMRLACPEDHPVMYSWRQEVGFAGALAVQAGGGQSWITCCAVQHKWKRSA